MSRFRIPPVVALVPLTMLMAAGVAVAALTEIWIYTFTDVGSFGGIAVASDGSVFWVGQEGEDNYIQHFDSDGNRTMRVQVKGRDVPYRVALMPDESMLLVAGESRPTNDSFPVPWIAAYTLAGKQQWSTRLDELELANVNRMIVSADGEDIYIAGSQTNFSSDPDTIFLARLTADGDVVWRKNYEYGDFPTVYAIALDPKKGARVCIGGEGGQFGDAPYQEALLACFDPADGSVLWDDLSGGTIGWDGIGGMVISPNGKKIYVVGYEDFTASLDPVADRQWFFQQFTAKNGKSKKRSYGTLLGAGADQPEGLVAADGGYWMIGQGCVDFSGGCDAYLVQLSARGKAQEMITYSVDGDREAIPEGVAVGPDGNPVWGGQVDYYDGPMWLQKLMR